MTNEGIGQHHEEIVLMALSEAEIPISRKEIITITGLKRSTVYDVLMRLILKKMVIRIYEEKEGPGRRKAVYQENRATFIKKME